MPHKQNILSVKKKKSGLPYLQSKHNPSIFLAWNINYNFLTPHYLHPNTILLAKKKNILSK